MLRQQLSGGRQDRRKFRSSDAFVQGCKCICEGTDELTDSVVNSFRGRLRVLSQFISGKKRLTHAQLTYIVH